MSGGTRDVWTTARPRVRQIMEAIDETLAARYADGMEIGGARELFPDELIREAAETADKKIQAEITTIAEGFVKATDLVEASVTQRMRTRGVFAAVMCSVGTGVGIPMLNAPPTPLNGAILVGCLGLLVAGVIALGRRP